MLIATVCPTKVSTTIKDWTTNTLDQVVERYEATKIQDVVDPLIKALPSALTQNCEEPLEKLTAKLKLEIQASLFILAMTSKASEEPNMAETHIDQAVAMVVSAVKKAVSSRYTFRMLDEGLVMIRWKPVTHVPSALEPTECVHVCISCYPQSPFLNHPKAAREMMEYLVSLEKNICVVITDTLNRFNMRAFGGAKTMTRATKLAIRMGDQFHKIMSDAKAEVEAEKGTQIERIQIVRWDVVETETEAQIKACVSFYEKTPFFRCILDDIARTVLETRNRDPNDAKRLDLVVQYILNELTCICFGFRHENTHFRELLYPTYWSSLNDGISNRIFGLAEAIHCDEGFAPLLKELQDLGACTGQSGVQFYPLAL